MERPRRFAKWALKVIIVLVVLFLGASAMVPVLEVDGYYCFYCGADIGTYKVLGVPIWRDAEGRSIYEDKLQTPPHSHRLVVLCGFKLWLFKGREDWDSFGWTGSGCRKALISGLKNYPDRRDQILREFMQLDHRDHDAVLRFVTAYRQAEERPKADQSVKSE